MSLAMARPDSCFEQLEGFLTEYDQRVSREQARMLVLAHKCKQCRFSFARLGETPIFVEDSRGIIHGLCSKCASALRGTDTDAIEIDLSRLIGMSRAIFGIMTGELRHTKLKKGLEAQVVPSVRQSKSTENSRERKQGFVRKHPARRRNRDIVVRH